MDKILYLCVNGVKIKATNSIDITAHSQNWFRCSFSFDSEWAAFPQKIAVFTNDKKTYASVALQQDNTCYIPSAVLKAAGYLYIGVLHSETEEKLPSEWTFVTVREGVDSGSAPEPPNQSVYIGIMETAGEALDYAREVKERAEAGEFNGAPGVGVPTGGASGQILAKSSGADFDTEWIDNQGGSGGGAFIAVGEGYAVDNGSVRGTLGDKAVDMTYNEVGAGGPGAYGERSFADSGGLAFGISSHADSGGSAIRDYSHADSSGSATHECSHADSSGWAMADYAHADSGGEANGEDSHADSYGETTGGASHADSGGMAEGNYSHAICQGGAAGFASYAAGRGSQALSDNAYAEGLCTLGGYSLLREVLDHDSEDKTVTLDNVTGLSVGDDVYIIHNDDNVEACSIDDINGFVVKLTLGNPVDDTLKFLIKVNESVTEFGSPVILPAHAEGNYTIATGGNSHAQNKGTIAKGLSQTAIGEYNIPQGASDDRAATDHAFIIGNGADGENRSNALTVDWAGNLTAAGEIEDGGGNTLSGLAEQISGLGGGMLASVYDPEGVEGDAFDMDNMTEGASNKILTFGERTKLSNLSGANTGDETASTIKTKLGITTLSGDNTGDQDLSGLQPKVTITANSDASPALGTVANNNEYRCTNSSIFAAPAMTVAAIASTATEFVCAVIFKAPNATAPVVTNNSGYTIKYSGQDVASGTWTPVTGTVYRMSIVFDGIYLNIYVSGVA